MSLKNLYPAGLFSLPKVFSSTSCLLIVLAFNRLFDIWLQLFLPPLASNANVSRETLGVQGNAIIKMCIFMQKARGDWKSARVCVHQWGDYSPPMTFFKGLCENIFINMLCEVVWSIFSCSLIRLNSVGKCWTRNVSQPPLSCTSLLLLRPIARGMTWCVQADRERRVTEKDKIKISVKYTILEMMGTFWQKKEKAQKQEQKQKQRPSTTSQRVQLIATCGRFFFFA